jgi:REP element-mobilizing transposase RayT
MSSPLRLEFAGALYHVTSRGNERKIIYLQEDDFELFLGILSDVCKHYNWIIMSSSTLYLLSSFTYRAR